MRITAAGMLLLLPRLSTIASDHRNADSTVISHIEKTTGAIADMSGSQKPTGSPYAGMLQKGAAALASIDRRLAIGLPGADAAGIKRSKNPYEKFSYDKGDTANSIDEFASAVSQEFFVFSNKNAHDKNKFKDKVIMIYGEDHTTPVLPSIRNGRGAFLVENPNPDVCLKKHKLYADNICKNIDITDKSEINNKLNQVYHSGRMLVQQLDPAEDRRIERKIQEPDLNINSLIIGMGIFIEGQFRSNTSPQKSNMLKKLEKNYHSFLAQSKKLNDLIEASLAGRDVAMASEAKKVIGSQKSGESTTIVVGSSHLKSIFNTLQREFPEHAIVSCLDIGGIDRWQPGQLFDFLKGIQADQIRATLKPARADL